MTDARQAVNYGIMFLDATIPNWAAQVDLLELDLRDPEHCVLGQTAGWARGTRDLMDYEGETRLAGTDDEWLDEAIFDYGFDIPPLEDYGYEELQEVWTEVIEDRQHQEPLL